MALLGSADVLYAARGKKVERNRPGGGQARQGDDRAAHAGPTGNLRAPTLRVGRTLLVGFDEGNLPEGAG